MRVAQRSRVETPQEPATGSTPGVTLVDNRPEAFTERDLTQAIDRSPRVAAQGALGSRLHARSSPVDPLRPAARIPPGASIDVGSPGGAEALAPEASSADRVRQFSPRPVARARPGASSFPAAARGGVIQRKLHSNVKRSTMKGIGVTVLKGLLNAVAPFFAGYDYAAALDAIHKDRTGDGVLYGHGMGLAILAGVKETAQLVATMATAAGILFGIISAFMPPVAAAATIASVVAASAHAVTLVLRTITAGALYGRLRKVHAAEYLKRGNLKARIYTELGGILGNVLGVVFGGLGGGFTPSQATNPLTNLAAEVSARQGGQTAAYLGAGQVGNTLADAAGGVGAAKAHGAEKRAARKSAGAGAVDLPVAPESRAPVSADVGGVAEAPAAGEQMPAAGEQMPVPAALEPEVAEEPEQAADEARVRDAVEVISQLVFVARKDQREAAEEQGELGQQPAALGEGQGELANVVDRIGQVRAAEAQMQGIEAAVPEDLGREQAPQMESALGRIEEAMPDAVEPDDGPAEAEPDDDGYLADDEREQDEEAQRIRQRRIVAQPQWNARNGPVTQAQDTKSPGVQKAGWVTRTYRKVKSKAKGLLARVFGLGRKIGKAFARAKAKFMAFVLRMLGLEKPAARAQAEITEQKSTIPAAIASQKGAETSGAGVETKASGAAAAIRKVLGK